MENSIEDLGRTRLIERVRALEGELARERERANTDDLTQLPNRRAGEAALRAQVSLAERNARPFAVLLIDIDHFKRINDIFGHDVGDDALRAVSSVLADNVRPSDLVCRWGGEEFMVVCADTTEAASTALAQRIRKAVSAVYVPVVDRQITVSIGVSGAPALVYEPDVLVREADRAMYEAKSLGRNRVARVFAA